MMFHCVNQTSKLPKGTFIRIKTLFTLKMCQIVSKANTEFAVVTLETISNM